MTLNYKFKKEKLEDGSYVIRPRILVELSGVVTSILVPALIDTGCDTTVIPERIATSIGLKVQGDKEKLYAFREYSEAIKSLASITFLGKERRQSITLKQVPVLIVLPKDSENKDEEEDIVLNRRHI